MAEKVGAMRSMDIASMDVGLNQLKISLKSMRTGDNKFKVPKLFMDYDLDTDDFDIASKGVVVKLHLYGHLVFAPNTVNAQSKLGTRRAYKSGDVQGVTGVSMYIGPTEQMVEVDCQNALSCGDVVPGWMVRTLKPNADGEFPKPTLATRFQALSSEDPNFCVVVLELNQSFDFTSVKPPVELTRLPFHGELPVSTKRTPEEREEAAVAKKRKALVKRILS